jgi:hypothetical protein
MASHFNLTTTQVQGKVCTATLRKPASFGNKSIAMPKMLPRQQRVSRVQPIASLPDAVAAFHPVFAALDIDWTDPDVQIGALGAFLGLSVGIGAPIFYISRDERDDERLEELRALNRATKAETGEYLSDQEIEAIRPPRWTDRREFVDDD